MSPYWPSDISKSKNAGKQGTKRHKSSPQLSSESSAISVLAKTWGDLPYFSPILPSYLKPVWALSETSIFVKEYVFLWIRPAFSKRAVFERKVRPLIFREPRPWLENTDFDQKVIAFSRNKACLGLVSKHRFSLEVSLSFFAKIGPVWKNSDVWPKSKAIAFAFHWKWAFPENADFSPKSNAMPFAFSQILAGFGKYRFLAKK